MALSKSITIALQHMQQAQQDLLTLMQQTDSQHWRSSYHHELSPLGWHLGHCAFVDRLWTNHRFEKARLAAQWHALYLPWQSEKTLRSSALKRPHRLLQWALTCQQQARQCLHRIYQGPTMQDALLRKGYVIWFLTQHHRQHQENMLMVMAQRQRQTAPAIAANPLPAAAPQHPPHTIHIAASDCRIGTHSILAYDNERPLHRRHLAAFRIAQQPVTNGEYLRFMQAGGYRRQELWSDSGWQWRQQLTCPAPEYWCWQSDGWYGVGPQGRFALDPQKPVTGLSYYEATAYARSIGGTLPREEQWERACRSKQLRHSGAVWEWCCNPFAPYHGFRSFPYQQYSVPWFDGQHRILRGGSCYSHRLIKRCSFRNYYLPQQRHVFAGCRPVFEA